jgi:hypothetical protein
MKYQFFTEQKQEGERGVGRKSQSRPVVPETVQFGCVGFKMAGAHSSEDN